MGKSGGMSGWIYWMPQPDANKIESPEFEESLRQIYRMRIIEVGKR